MANNKRITIGLDFNVNSSQIQQLKEQLKQIQINANIARDTGNLTDELKNAAIAAEKLEEALNGAWNNKLGQLDLSKLNKSIKESYGDLNKLKTTLTGAGTQGAQSFNSFSKAVLNTNTQIKQTNKLLDSMATSMANTVKWGVTSAIFNNIANSIQKAWDYSIKLDSSLNDIRIVTGKSADEMERFAQIANNAAKNLGASTLDYTDAALIYYQQGLNEKDVQARANTTLKVANVTGQSGQAVSEQLTAVWNGYKVSAEEAELYIDKLSAVAATTAADLEELSTGMSKVASAANAMGVDVDQLNAQLATIVSVTRQAPESVGTALKTIYARMSDIEAGIEEGGVTLGNYTEQMEQMGISVLNAKGELRDMGAVVEEIGSNWTNYSREQQIALAQIMAGTRQYNNLIALFDNWNLYSEALNESKNSAGELQKQQDIYMESTEAYLQKLATEAEKTYDILFDDTAIKSMTNALTGLLSIFNNFLSGLGGGLNSLSFLGLSAVNLFSNQIGGAIGQRQSNKEKAKSNTAQAETKKELINMLNKNQIHLDDAGLNEILPPYKKYLELKKNIKEETQTDIENSLRRIGVLKEESVALKEYFAIWEKHGQITSLDYDKLNNKNFNVAVGKLEDELAQSEILSEILSGNYGSVEEEEASIKFQDSLIEMLIKRDAVFAKIEQNDAGLEWVAEFEEINEDFEKSQDVFKKSLNSLIEKSGLNIEKMSKQTQEIFINNIQELVNADVRSLENLSIETITERFNNIIEQLKNEIKETKSDIKKVKDVYDKQGTDATGKPVNLSDKQKNIEDEKIAEKQWVKEVLDSKKREENIAILTRGLTTISSLGIALSGIFQTLNNDALSFEEQVAQIFPTLAIGIIQLITNSKSLTASWKVLKKLMAGFVLEHGGRASSKSGFFALAKQALSAKVSIVGLTASLGTIILTIGSVVAIIGVLIYTWYRMETSAKRAMETAIENAEVLEERYKSLNEEATKLNETITNYKDSLEAFEKLKKGAEGYQEALEKANKQAKELIEQHKLYDDYIVEDGLIKITPSKLDTIQGSMNEKAFNALERSYSSKMTASEKSYDYDVKRLADKIYDIETIQVENEDYNPYSFKASEREKYKEEDRYFSMSEEQVEQVVKALQEIKNSDDEGQGNYLRTMNEGFESFILNLFKGNEEIGYLSDVIVENKQGFERLLETVEDMAEENAYYVKQLNQARIEKLYGEDIRKAAIDPETGEVDEAMAQQITHTLNESGAGKASTESQQSIRDFTNNSNYFTADYWRQEWFIGDRNKQLTKDLTDMIGSSGLSFKDIYGIESFEDDEDVARAFARTVLNMNAEEVRQLIFADGILQTADGQTKIVDMSSQDKRGNIRAQTAAYGIVKDSDTHSELLTEDLYQFYLNNTTELKNKGFQAGKSFGTDWSKNIVNSLTSGKLDLSSSFKDLSPEEITRLRELSQEEFLKLFDIEEDDIKHSALKTTKNFYDSAQESLKNYEPAAFLKTIKDKILNISDIASSLSKGDDLNEEQLKFLKNLEKEYEQLGFIQDKTSSRYLEALQEVNNKLEEEAIGLEQLEASELIGEGIKITGDTDELTDKLEEISEANYEVVVAIKADAQSDFDNVVNKMTLIEEMASKIGDDFVVSANDIEELNNTFPGIVTGMELLADGSAKLNKQSVQDAIKTAQANAQLKTQELVDSLQKQQLEVLAKRDAAQKIADIAKKQAEGAELNADVESDINENLNILKQDNAEITTDYEKQTQKDVVDSSKENSDKMASNFSGAYKKMAADSKAWADAAKQNLLVAQTGEGETTAGSFSGDYHATGSGTIITTAQKGDLKNSEDLPKTSEEWLEVQKFYEDLAKTYDETANNFQGKIAEALAKNNEFNKTLSNIGKGLGSDGKKDGGKDELDHIDRLESELDLYHDINIELGRIDKQLSQLKNQQDKLLGQDLINNLNEQFTLLQKQIEKTKDKISDMTDEANALKDDLGKKNIEFNEDGTIKNYTQAYNDALAYVNGLIDQYNAMTDKASQEAFKETVETAKEEFEQFEEDLKRYTEIIEEEIPDLNEDIQNAFDEQIEIRIEKFNTEIEIRLEMAQAERDWNEFKKNVIDKIADDDILGNAKARLQDFHSYYKEGETEGAIEETTRHINDILFELGEMDRGIMSNFYGDDKATAFEDLKKYYGQLMEDLTAVEELSKEVRQSYLDMMDKAQEDFDKQINKYEQITDLIDHDMKLIELLHGDKSYEAFGKYYEKQEENYNQQLDFQRRQVDFWAAEMEAAGDDAERWAIAEENWSSAVTEWKSLINTAIENIQDKYLNTIKSIFEELNNKVTGDLGLEYVNEQWGLINRNAEEYLDAINAMYGIEDLQNKYLDAIDKTDSLSAQRKLNELMEQEVKALEEKDKLTQYDVDRAMKKYDIALKQIALEEAQQNKTFMRLKRDSQGNYSYQFTADEDAVKAAEDELAAAQNELYNFDKENYINNLDEIYAAWEEYQEKMFEAEQINDPEKKLAREKLLNEQYGELINGLTSQNLTIRNNLYESAFEEHSRLYDRELEEYLNMTQAQKDDLLTELIPQWDSGVQYMADVFAGEGGFTEVCKEAMGELSEATKAYNKDLEQIEKSAEITFETVVDGTDEAINETKELLEENDELIESYEDELEAIQDVIDELDTLIEKFNDARDAAIEAAQAAYEYQQTTRGDFDADDFSDTTDFSKVMTDQIQAMSAVKNYDMEKDTYLNQLIQERDEKIGRDEKVTSASTKDLKKVFAAYLDPDNSNHDKAVELIDLVDRKQAYYTAETLRKYGFDTGGYTGAWAGEAGRLALLHQKELVLNAEDTKNILNAVQVLRTIDGSVLQRLASMNGTIGVPKGNLDTTEAIEQNVHIDAQFPNVTNSHEIENAFNNLINIASQRAFRKK